MFFLVGRCVEAAFEDEDSAGQVPEEPGIDGAEERVAGLRFRARAGDVVQQPFELQPREVARERQAGFSAEPILAAVDRGLNLLIEKPLATQLK